MNLEQQNHQEIMLLKQRVGGLEGRDDDKERRLRLVESRVYMGLGGLAALQVALFIVQILLHK